MEIRNSKFKIQNCSSKFKIFGFVLNFILLTLTLHFALLAPRSLGEVGLTFNSGKAWAQEMRTFTVVPPAIEKSLDPGQTAEGVMKIINDSSEALSFRVDTQDYVVLDSNGTPNILPPDTLSSKYSAAAWVGVVPNAFTVEPHQKMELNYYLQVPKDARPGGHYTAVVFLPLTSGSLAGSGASVQTKVGTLLKINVNGAINELSNVTRFLANPFQEYGPVKIQTQVKNLGDLHVKPAGTITVTDMLGRTIEEQKISDFNIFPEAARDYENTIGTKFMIGRFKASFTGSYGKFNNLPLMTAVYFWVFPWKITLVIILIIVAIMLGMMLAKKNRINNKPQEETPSSINT